MKFMKNSVFAVEPLWTLDSARIAAFRNQSSVQAFSPWDLPVTYDDIQFYKYDRQQTNLEKPMDSLYLGIIFRQSGELLCEVDLTNHSSDKNLTEMCCYGNARFYSDAYGMEALQWIVNQTLTTFNKHKIYCYCLQENSSLALMLRAIGFEEEAYLRENVFIRGQVHDEIYFGKLQN